MYKSCSYLVIIILVAMAAVVYSAPTLDDASPSAVVTTTLQPLPDPGEPSKVESRGKMSKRMVLPLMVGILLKVGSLLPVILGKLTLMAVGSILTSKLALLIAAILVIHKFQTESSSWTMAGSSTTDESYSSYPYRRRG